MARSVNNRQRVIDHEEVFTPPALVADMLDLVASECDRTAQSSLAVSKMAKKQVKVIEKALLFHAQGEGHTLFNKKGTRLPTDVWIAGHEIPVAPSLQVEPAPIGRQRPSQRGLAALPRANDGNAGKRREILGKKGLTGSFHALQNKT